MGPKMRRKGFTLIELMIVIAIIAIIAAVAIPSILIATRTANENNASSSLKQMCSCETLFKSSDTDANSINDYYTADVRGLFYLSSTTPSTSEIKMLEIAMVLADGNPDPGAEYTNSTVPGSPKAGYWFQVHTGYESPSGTANAYGRRHLDRYAYCAYPNSYPSSGRLVYWVSEGGTMFKRDPLLTTNYLSTPPSIGNPDPGGVLQTLYANTPFNPLASSTAVAAGPWSKMD